MEKSEAITAFKELCKNPLSIIQRQKAVDEQLYRHAWQVGNSDLYIRISDAGSCGHLAVYIKSDKQSPLKEPLYIPSIYRITIEEYNELKNIYFADTTPVLINE